LIFFINLINHLIKNKFPLRGTGVEEKLAFPKCLGGGLNLLKVI
jgi:hypothetical protein